MTQTAKKYFTYDLPKICVNEIQFCNQGKFFYAKYKESGFHIVARYTFEEILFFFDKQGFQVVNQDGSIYKNN